MHTRYIIVGAISIVTNVRIWKEVVAVDGKVSVGEREAAENDVFSTLWARHQ